MIKRKLAGASALFAALALVSGCGSSKKSTTGTTTSSGSGSGSSTTTNGSALPNLSGQSFTILGVWTSGEQAAFQAVLNDFDQKTGAKGTYTPAAGGNLTTVLGTQVSGGTPPDIAMLSFPGSIQSYAAAGKIQPVNSATQSAVNANYSSVWAQLGSANGTLYGVPVDASDKSTVWYNANAFKNAGITSDPATWQDFINDAKTLSSSGVSVPISVGGGDGWTLTDWFENVYLRTAGLDDYNMLAKHQLKWTDPTVTTALNDLNQIWGDSSLIGSRANAVKVPFTGSVDNVFKASPSSAIVYEASFVATTITSDNDPSPVGTTAKFFVFPSINNSPAEVEAAGDFAVAFTKNPAAAAFQQYLASPAAAKILVSAQGSGFLSPNKNLDNSSYPDATTAGLGKAIINAGNNLVFDMSDEAPAAFGGTAGQGEWLDLQNFLSNGNVQAAQTALEADAAKQTWTS
jgi:ABC-type glycerol-3-phosphate transport system substrate-binding protein